MTRKIITLLMAMLFICLPEASAKDRPSDSTKAAHEQTDSISAAPVLTILNPDDLNVGDVREGVRREVTLRFRNDGGSPLVITRAFADCGCTRVKYTDDPVEPGGEGVITLHFNSRGQRTGSFLKTIKLRANTENRIERIYLTGRVND